MQMPLGIHHAFYFFVLRNLNRLDAVYLIDAS